jgi:hypothetical protein
MKKIFFFIAVAFLTLSSCKKEGITSAKDKTMAESQFVENSAQSAPDNNSNVVVSNAVNSNKPLAVTFILTRGSLIIAGAIEASGTYTMNPVVQTGHAFHCTNNLTTSQGTITALTNCYDNSTGTWRIISGTGAYANLSGNGTLVMYPGGETWSGKIF